MRGRGAHSGLYKPVKLSHLLPLLPGGVVCSSVLTFCEILANSIP